MTTPTPSPDAAERAQAKLRVLQRLVEVGMAQAEALECEALQRPPGQATDGAPELAFARVSRAIRLCLVLQTRIEGGEDLKAREAADARRREAVEERRDDIAELVEDAIAAEQGCEGEAVERLIDALDERLEREAPEAFADRPMGEMVALICRDLGVTPDWAQWAGEDWAAEEILAHPPGSPYAAWPRAALRLRRPKTPRRLPPADPGAEETPPPPQPLFPTLTEDEWFEMYTPPEFKAAQAQARPLAEPHPPPDG